MRSRVTARFATGSGEDCTSYPGIRYPTVGDAVDAAPLEARYVIIHIDDQYVVYTLSSVAYDIMKNKPTHDVTRHAITLPTEDAAWAWIRFQC